MVLAILAAACTPSEDDLIGKAQLCVDKAVPSDAMTCIEPIRNSSKASAQIVKCSAGFLAENFGRGARILKAYRQLEDPSEGTASFLGVMTFNSHGTPEENRTFSREINGYCQQTDQKSYRLLGAMGLTATTISAAGGLHWSRENPPTKDDIHRAIMNLRATRNDPQTIQAFEEVGTAVVIMFENACTTEEVANQKLCDQAKAALSGGSDKSGESIGERILDLWD